MKKEKERKRNFITKSILLLLIIINSVILFFFLLDKIEKYYKPKKIEIKEIKDYRNTVDQIKKRRLKTLRPEKNKEFMLYVNDKYEKSFKTIEDIFKYTKKRYSHKAKEYKFRIVVKRDKK